MRYADLLEASNPMDNPNFRRWFAGSKVVDADGAPLVVHHGTSNPEFAAFSSNGGMGGALGFWFASTHAAAQRFAMQRYAGVKPGVISVYLNIQQPMEFDGYAVFLDAVRACKGNSQEAKVRAFRRKLERAGHDGIVIRNSDTDGGGLRDDWVALRPEQIKSVTNKGTFDASRKRFDEKAPSSTFPSWFGKSVVVDDQGDPLVLYHGTGADVSSFKGMVWASVTPNLANVYADLRHDMGGSGNVMPVYMRIERPFDADRLPKTVSVGVFFTEAARQAREAGRNFSNSEAAELVRIVKEAAREESSGPHYDRHDFWFETYSFFGRTGVDAIRRLFEMFGFDGVTMTEKGEMTFGAFSPSQVKSAIGNRGTFDPASASLTEDRKIKDLKGNTISAPRVFYRGTNPGSTKRIRTGDNYWDSFLFVSSNIDGARMYGSHITVYEATPDARILYEGTKEFVSLAKGLKTGKWNLLTLSSAIARRAQEAGYDAVWFKQQTDVGTVIINQDKFIKTGEIPQTEQIAEVKGEPRYFTVGELRERGSRALDEWEDAGYPTRDNHRLMMGANQCRVQRQVFGNDQTLDEAEKPLKKRSLTPEEKTQVKIHPSRLECSIAYFDGNGYAAYTHRARSKFYKKVGDIPKKTLEFISSTS